MTKIDAMKRLEAEGLSFTANVIVNGCGRPTAKMKALIKLIDAGKEVRHAQFETCAVVIDGEFVWFGSIEQKAADLEGGEK